MENKRYVTVTVLVICCLLCGCRSNDSALKDSEWKSRQMLASDNESAISFADSAKPNHLALARDLIQGEFYDVALLRLKEAGKENSGNPEVFCLMGVCKRELGSCEDAVRHFKRALKLDGDYAPAYNGLGLTYAEIKEKVKARKNFEQALHLNPARSDFHNNLGYLQLLDGELAMAEDCFRKSLAISPDFMLAKNNLGICLGMMGKEDEALSIFRSIMSTAAALNNMGVIYEKLLQQEKAIALYKRALKEAPQFEEARKNLLRLSSGI